MFDSTFIALVVLFIGAGFVLLGRGALWYMNRSSLYSQDRYDKAFWAIVKRERRLAKQRARNEKHKETVDGLQ